jgi:hypothetical protein
MMSFVVFLVVVMLGLSFDSVKSEDIEGETGYVDFAEEMRGAQIDINTSTIEDLLKLPGMTPSVASRLIQVREQVGGFKSTTELVKQGVMREELYGEISPFIKVRQEEVHRVDNVSVRTREIGKWSSDGESTSRWGNYLRIKWNRSESWNAGVLAERDPGERRVMDNLKWALSHRRKAGILRQVVFGNIRYELSRGLFFYTRSRVNKASQVLAPAGRKGRGLGMDLSTTESYLLKGVGLELGIAPDLSLTALLSSTSLDVSRDETGGVTSVRTSGDHSHSSADNRDRITLTTIAGHLAFSPDRRGVLGLTLAELRYSEEIAPPLDNGRFHDFRGSKQIYAGLDWDFVYSGMGFFGEGGLELNRGWGYILGIENETGLARWNILFRDYDPDFSPPFGNPFQDGSGAPSNESGFYSGLDLKFTRDVRFALYLDSYRRAWRRIREPFPVKENEMFVEGRWRPKSGVWLAIRFIERRGEKVEYGELLSKNRDCVTRKLRFQIDWGDKPLEFRGRYEHVLSSRGYEYNETGSLLYFDTRLRARDRLSLDLRVTFFETESINSGVYTYEVSLPGLMRIVPLIGEGMRWYLNGRYRFRNDLTISVKFDETTIFSMDGSGIESARTDKTVGIQVDYRR